MTVEDPWVVAAVSLIVSWGIWATVSIFNHRQELAVIKTLLEQQNHHLERIEELLKGKG